jgi:hypothetical protein
MATTIDTSAEYRRTVERLSLMGSKFADVEAVIERSRLRDDQKAALWLLAWSYQAPEVQRKLARETLAAIG